MSETVSKDQAVIPGRGFIFTAAPNTAAPDLAQFNKATPEKSFSDWTWIGLTSKDSLPQLSFEGGESAVRDSWEYAGIRVETSPKSYSLAISAINVTKENLELGLPGGKWDNATKSYAIPGNVGSTDRAVIVVFIDNKNGVSMMYFPNGAVSMNEAPEISADGFMTLKFNVAAQAGATGESFRWFVPRVV